MDQINYQPIGFIHSPFKTQKGTPIQPTAAQGVEGVVEVLPDFTEGLKDLGGFSHIILLYHFHLSTGYQLTVKPFLDSEFRGLFATRAPARPNPIGLSIVRLTGIQGNRLHILDVDIIDGTPLLDIKPYVRRFDHREGTRAGWVESQVEGLPSARDDGRFSNDQGTNRK